ncbi:MAG: hypothetical protein IJ640_05335 [Prevotella sp.]|nr:hypothetical protein [Prevotella sp.]MBR1526067.1 hypothetical protein [Prevotella sp.]MDY6229358.1 hypothetical protein [Prevotella sp.]
MRKYLSIHRILSSFCIAVMVDFMADVFFPCKNRAKLVWIFFRGEKR